MDIETIRKYCLEKPYTIECMPFDDDTLVFKVGIENDKCSIFALISLTRRFILLKCNPQQAIELRERYAAINPAWHMNKTHWNEIDIYSHLITQTMLHEMVDHSYELVLKNLPKRVRDIIK